MLELIARDKEFRFYTNKELLEEAKSNSKKHGVTLSRVLDLVVKQIALTGEVELLDEAEIQKRGLAKQLQAEVKKGVDSIEAGRGVGLEEARARFGV